MRPKSLGLLAFAVVIAVFVFIGIPASDWYAGESLKEVLKLFPGSLAAGVTVAGVILGLSQYLHNSHVRRVEKSMSFWQRSNTNEFTTHLTPYLDHCRKLDAGEDVPEFERIARLPNQKEETVPLHVAIEYLLDFYDEACSGVLAGACDETAMRFYLGSAMIREWKSLAGYIQICLKKYQRPEKWNAFLTVAESWAKGYRINSKKRIVTPLSLPDGACPPEQL